MDARLNRVRTGEPAGRVLPPVHCPSSADGQEFPEDLDLFGECDRQERPKRHRLIAGVEARARAWLGDVTAELPAASLNRLEISHPDRRRDSVIRAELDPTTAHVIFAAGRQGVRRAPVLYVGLVCQHISSAWHGVGGIYVPVCTCPQERDGAAAVRRIAVALSAESRTVDVPNLPPGLTPRRGWWENRLRVTLRLPSPDDGLWAVGDPAVVRLRRREAILIRSGYRQSAEPNLIFVDRTPDLDLLLPALFGDGPREAAYRRGPGALLRRLASDDPSVLRRPDGTSTGGRWGALWLGHQVQLVRSVAGAQGTVQDGGVQPVVAAPRLGGGGAVDLSALLREFDPAR